METVLRVLVVEDDDNLRALWGEVFAQAGHDCDEIGDAATARAQLLREAYDAIVLDLYLGDESGLSVATLATYANPDCRVIVITGSALFPRGELFGISPAVASVLRKPVDIGELLAVSEYGLQGRAPSRIRGDIGGPRA